MTISPHLYALGIFFFVALMNACVKGLDESVPLSLIVCVRFSIGLMMCYPAIYRRGGFRKTLVTRNPYKQVARSMLSMTGIAFTFYAIPRLPLGDATALWNSLAFFLLLLSAPITGEKIDYRHYLVCLVGFAGVLLIAHPHGTDQIVPVVLMLASALMAATTTLTVRFMSRTDDEITIMTWLFGLSAIVSFVWWLGFSPKEALQWKQVALLAGAGVFGSISQLSMTRAMRALKADVMGPYTYSGIVFAVVFGLVFFDEKPSLWMAAGAALIIVGIQLSRVLNKRLSQ